MAVRYLVHDFAYREVMGGVLIFFYLRTREAMLR